MKFDIIDTLNAFDELAGDWRDVFAASSARGNVFATYDWHRAYLKHFWPNNGHGSAQLAIVVGRQRGKVQVICPLILRRQFGAKILSWIGDPVSQYGDAVVRDTKNAARMVNEALRFVAREKQVDALVLARMRDDGAAAAAMKLNQHHVLKHQNAPFTDLTAFATVDEYIASQTANRKKQHRRLWRRLEERGATKFEVLRSGPDAKRWARAALDLKARMLAQQGTISRAFAHDCFAGFFEDLAADPSANVGFRMSLITANEQLVSAEIGFESSGHYIAHIGVFDSAFQRFAPGRLQIDRTLRSCLDEGLRRYDFLPPDSDYKRAWSTKSIGVIDACIPLTSKGRIVCSLLKTGSSATDAMKKRLPAPVLKFAARLALLGANK